MNTEIPVSHRVSRDRDVEIRSGWLLLAAEIILILLAIWLLFYAAERPSAFKLYAALGLLILTVLVGSGFFTLQPNEAGVRLLFGKYCGTVHVSGFLWTSPFVKIHKVSLRARNFNSEKLKVNDKRGPPVEIAAVVVWRVRDTARALFDVDNYTSYVTIQSESALRHLASSYLYDDGGSSEVTLRGGGDAVSAALVRELQERLSRAGVEVEEARITHLAYAPEIAQAMLRRQQAEAVIAARQKIVAGAVGMVEMALNELAERHVVNLDDERRAAMVSNLLVVLCGEADARPVINAGTLYN
jgi:regulator of protease activity HflC (stomatin/prohibitin superfamily)